jgi:hypothetical protein
MIQIAVIGAVAAVCGGVAAVSSRDSRIVVAGLLLAMLATPIVSSPEPAALDLAFRFLGAMLAAYLIWAAARAQSTASEGSGIGAMAEVAVAGAAFCVGWFVVPVKPLAGPIAAQAAGVALIALAIAPLTGRNLLRVGAGATLLTLGIYMLLEAWVGAMSPLGQIAQTAVLLGIAGATGLLMAPVELLPATVSGADGAPERAAPNKETNRSEDGAEPSPDAAPARVVVSAAGRIPATRPPAAQAHKAAARHSAAGSSEGMADAGEAAAESPVPSPLETPTPNRIRGIRPREPRR